MDRQVNQPPPSRWDRQMTGECAFSGLVIDVGESVHSEHWASAEDH